MILEKIVAKRKEQLEREIKQVSREQMCKLAKETVRPITSLYDALKKDTLSVISEVKKASPSKAVIREDFNPVEIAKQYEQSGANAISCLTEEFYFQGSSSYLADIRANVNIPIIRKDFIFDEYQIYEARVIGADAILLIASILDTQTLIRFKELAESLGMQCLFEVHDEEELAGVLQANPSIVGINNRNLKTFEVSLDTTKMLAEKIPKHCVIVSESGIADNSDMKRVKEYGADAVLVGETLMRSENIAETMRQLRVGI